MATARLSTMGTGTGIRRERFLGVSAPQIGDAEIAEVVGALRSGWLISGPRVAEFQRALADYVHAPYVRCLGSCTASLGVGLHVLGVQPGDEVLVPAVTFASCANVVVHLGATPVLVDCVPDTGLVDLADAERKVTPATRVLMPVHLAGHPVDLDAVAAFAERHGVAVLEDAAHAIGAAWRERPVGAHGNLVAFSFHATKNVTTIEGGALAFGDPELDERIERLSQNGITRSSWARHGGPDPAGYDVPEPGWKAAMHDVSAALGIAQLPRLDDWIAQRRAVADLYDARLAGLPLELPPRPPAHARHAHHLYIVRLAAEAPVSRDRVAEMLRERNIGSSVHFRGLHLHSWYRDRYGIEPSDLPNATAWSERALTLPLYPGMTEGDVEDVARALQDALA